MAKQVWKPGNMLYPVPAVMEMESMTLSRSHGRELSIPIHRWYRSQYESQDIHMNYSRKTESSLLI